MVRSALKAEGSGRLVAGQACTPMNDHSRAFNALGILKIIFEHTESIN